MISQDGLRPAVVVTGASSGIGRAIAKVAARERAAIVLIGRSEEALNAVAAEVRALGGEPFALALDLLAENSTTQVRDFLLGRGLFCDVLVNSDGRVAIRVTQVTETTVRFTAIGCTTRNWANWLISDTFG